MATPRRIFAIEHQLAHQFLVSEAERSPALAGLPTRSTAQRQLPWPHGP